MGKNLLLWLIIAAVLLTVFNNFSVRPQPQEITYSSFISEVQQDQVHEVAINGLIIIGKRKSGEDFKVVRPPIDDPKLMDELINHNVNVIGEAPEQQSIWAQLLIASFPILIIIAVFMLFMRQMQGGAGGRGGPMAFGKSKARLLSEDQIKTTFADVAGVDEAKEDVQELVDFLRDPGKFQKLGGRIPRGILMVGPPGTGKTLLAKAIAGEAKVPFFTISGSDFVEMFVGVGASRVRDMFEQAKKQSPCIIFIDEIDAVGRHRGAGLGGGHDEREQTLNQLLVEMDGFEPNDGIIVIAATNRPDVLDPALLRPGRFDRQVVVGLPDIRGREQILKVHMRKVPLADDVDASIIARGTPGFSGADLANLVNEAALFAARASKRLVEMDEFEQGKRQNHDGRRAQIDGDVREREAHDGVSRGWSRDRRPERAGARSGVQGHDHAARSRAGRDDVPAGRRPLQPQPSVHSVEDQFVLRRTYCRRDGARSRRRHHRCIQRHRAGDSDWLATWSRSGACPKNSGR